MKTIGRDARDDVPEWVVHSGAGHVETVYQTGDTEMGWEMKRDGTEQLTDGGRFRAKSDTI